GGRRDEGGGRRVARAGGPAAERVGRGGVAGADACALQIYRAEGRGLRAAIGVRDRGGAGGRAAQGDLRRGAAHHRRGGAQAHLHLGRAGAGGVALAQGGVVNPGDGVGGGGRGAEGDGRRAARARGARAERAARGGEAAAGGAAAEAHRAEGRGLRAAIGVRDRGGAGGRAAQGDLRR